MSRDLEILKHERGLSPSEDGWFLRSREYVLDYRLMICRALLHHVALHASTDVPAILTRAIQSIDQDLAFDEIADLFRLYPIVGGSGVRGLVVVDTTKGCYPLILYRSRPPNVSPPDYRHLRADRFVEALETIRDRWRLIRTALQGRDVQWTARLQDQLVAQLPLPSRDDA